MKLLLSVLSTLVLLSCRDNSNPSHVSNEAIHLSAPAGEIISLGRPDPSDSEDWTRPETFIKHCAMRPKWGHPLYQVYTQLKRVLHTEDCTELANRVAKATRLDFRDARSMISNVYPLMIAKELTDLKITGQFVHDIIPLAALTNLRSLELESNFIRDLRPLTGLVELRSLSIGGNPITDITPLLGLNQLESLSLHSLFVLKDLQFVRSFPKLRDLSVGFNSITSLAGLEALPLLETLSIAENRVSDLGILDQLPRLTRVNVRNNLITSLASLARFNHSDQNDAYFRGNPLVTCPVDKDMPNKALSEFCTRFHAHPEFYKPEDLVLNPPNGATASTVRIRTMGSICTGVVVSADLILTSADCSVLQSNGTDTHNIITFLPTAERPYFEYRYGVEAAIYANHNRHAPNFDIAWVRIAGGLPLGVTPAAIRQSQDKPAPGLKLWLTSLDKDSAVVEQTSLREYRDDSIYFSLFSVGPKPLVNQSLCKTGGGGPAFVEVNGAWQLMGLFAGTELYFNPASYTSKEALCVSGDLAYTHVPDYLPWIAASSGENLGKARIAHVAEPLDAAQEADFTSYEDWCNYPAPTSEAWHTARILRDWAVRQYLRETGSNPDHVYFDCKLTGEALRRMIAADLETPTITSTRYVGRNIKDLKPVATLQGIHELVLDFDVFPELGPLAGLENLESLMLKFSERHENPVPGLGQLKQVKSLYLNLDNIPAGLMEAISGMESLEELTIVSYNHELAVSLTPLAALPHLAKLKVEGLTFDPDEITALKSLERLDLRDIRVPGIVAKLAALPRLTELSMQEFSYDAKDLAHLEHVRALHIQGFGGQALVDALNRMPRLESLKLERGADLRFGGMLNLRHLELHSFHISDGASLLLFAPDSNLESLTLDELSGTFDAASLLPLQKLSRFELNGKIKNLEKLSEVKPLRHLGLVETGIAQNSAFATILQMTWLESLHLKDRRITSIPALVSLQNLRYLDLSKNEIALSGVADLPQLEVLKFNRGRASSQDLSSLQNLPNLRELYLKDQYPALDSMTALPTLPSLEILDVRMSRVLHLGPLKQFPRLREAALGYRWTSGMETCPVSDNICVFADEVPPDWNPASSFQPALSQENTF